METLEFKEFASSFGIWADKFKSFITGKDMYEIYQTLKRESVEDGYTICPDSDNTFRALATCPKPKVIFELLDPYPRMYPKGILQATGIAMDCSNSPDGKIQPSLKAFYEAVEADMGYKVEKSPDLLYLQEQGVMLLNTDLTCRLNQTGSHEGLWLPFQKYFLEEVLKGEQLIYVLCGKVSHRLEGFISPFGNHIFKLDHPSFAARTKVPWKTDNLFSKINKILTEQGKETIFWSKRDWEQEAPF